MMQIVHYCLNLKFNLEEFEQHVICVIVAHAGAGNTRKNGLDPNADASSRKTGKNPESKTELKTLKATYREHWDITVGKLLGP